MQNSPAARLRPLLRYAGVGALATAVHYLLLALLVEGVGWPAWLGSGMGAVVGAQVAYLGNRRWTFAAAGSTQRSWLRFQITAGVGAVAGMVVVATGVASGLHYLLAQLLATALVLLLTFEINRRWSFVASTGRG